ncbi:MAG: ABC transporter ATP-binding protein [Promethearchaeota archaeon]
MQSRLKNVQKNISQPIIEISNLEKTYNIKSNPVHALKDVTFNILSGELIFIMGPSGSGKTTLLNLVGGIDSPTNGNIIVCGEKISDYSDRKLTKYRKARLSFVFQFYSLIPTLTALENVELIMELIGINRRKIRKQAKDYLVKVHLEDRLNNFPSQLSGGERQRVAIARALAKNPEILLIDEPTGQLDQETGEEIVSLIRDVSKHYKKTVLLVTHDQDLKKYADRIVELRSGKIISDSKLN